MSASVLAADMPGAMSVKMPQADIRRSCCPRATLHQSQASDVLPPPLHQAVPFRLAAFVLNAALAECEFVLGVNERRRCLRIGPVNPTRPQHAISDKGLIFFWGYRTPDFARQFLADHTSFPHAAAPDRERHDQPERSECYELDKTS